MQASNSIFVSSTECGCVDLVVRRPNSRKILIKPGSGLHNVCTLAVLRACTLCEPLRACSQLFGNKMSTQKCRCVSFTGHSQFQSMLHFTSASTPMCRRTHVWISCTCSGCGMWQTCFQLDCVTGDGASRQEDAGGLDGRVEQRRRQW